jgi:hypothetical protein
MARRGPFTTCKPEYGYDASDDVLLARKDARCPSSDKESQNRLMWERGSGASVE